MFTPLLSRALKGSYFQKINFSQKYIFSEKIDIHSNRRFQLIFMARLETIYLNYFFKWILEGTTGSDPAAGTSGSDLAGGTNGGRCTERCL